MTVYGPYESKTAFGRLFVIHYNNGQRRTQSYPRYIMENHLGRKLEDWEHVDHINDDFSNNQISNLQLLTQAENNKKSAKPAKFHHFTCACGKFAKVLLAQYKNNQIKQKKKGPFCSRSCAGKYGY